jgi:hypothetical protein
MNYEYPQSDLSRGVLGGLFAGIVAAMTNLIFVFIYRQVTAFYEFNVIDVGVVIFGSILQSIACGLIFYFFIHFLKKGMLLYRVTVVLVTILIILFGIALRQSIMGPVPMEFRVMVVVTQTIIGGLGAFLIPYLYRHDSIIS